MTNEGDKKYKERPDHCSKLGLDMSRIGRRILLAVYDIRPGNAASILLQRSWSTREVRYSTVQSNVSAVNVNDHSMRSTIQRPENVRIGSTKTDGL